MEDRIQAIQTIGYQNLNFIDFINILQERGVRLVIDVRNNPFSFKKGFSKKWLSSHLPEYHIDYINIPELGIPSKYRKELAGSSLWNKYKELLNMNAAQLQKAADIIQKQAAVLMCFEAHPADCHRSRLAEKLNEITGLPVTHYNQAFNTWRECKEEFSSP
jgi:uncharacterized protein (DUF488 family)